MNKKYYSILKVNSINIATWNEDLETAYKNALEEAKHKCRSESYIKEIEQAYQVLKDPQKKTRYDTFVNKLTELTNAILALESQLTTYDEDKQSFLKKAIPILTAIKKQLYTQKSSLTDEEDLNLIECTINLVNSLNTSADKKYNELVLSYGEQLRKCLSAVEVISFKSPPSHLQKNQLQLANQLILETLGYQLTNLDLYYLDMQIQRLQSLSEKNEIYKAKFISCLNAHKERINYAIADYCEKLKKCPENKYIIYYNLGEVINIPAVEIAKDTTQILSNLKYDEKYKEEDRKTILAYEEKYIEKCHQYPEFKNFAKGVASVLIGGLAFVLALPFSLAACALGVMSCQCEALMTLAFPFMAAEAGTDLGRKLTKLPANISLSESLFFKNPYSDYKKVVTSAKNYIDSDLKAAEEEAKLMQPILV